MFPNENHIPCSFRSAYLLYLLIPVLFGASSCSKDDNTSLPGTIKVTVFTNGIDKDTDGYTIILDGAKTNAIGPDGEVTFELVEAGRHQLRLEGNRLNCDPAEGFEQSVVVQSGTASSVSFSIDCTSKPIVFASSRNGQSFEVYRMNLDGSGVVAVTSNGGWGPRWSPDGQQIAYFWDEGVYLINEDGTGQRQLTDKGSPASWSPDGQKLAYAKEGQLYVINKDGTGETLLANISLTIDDVDWGPANDPRIIFNGLSLTGTEPAGIFIVNADGSNLTRLTEGPDFQPSWSPDGTTIAFASDRDGNVGIYTMPVSGGVPVRRTGQGAMEVAPQWSPDGTQMTFTTLLQLAGGGFNQEVCIGSSSAPGATNLTQNPEMDLRSDWRPGY